MDGFKSAPKALKIVAWLFIFEGCWAALDILISLCDSIIDINLGVLGILIGRGLLRFRRGWRTCGLVFIWIDLIALPIAWLLTLDAREPIPFKFFGLPIGGGPKELAIALEVLWFALAVWELRVLKRPDIVKLFWE